MSSWMGAWPSKSFLFPSYKVNVSSRYQRSTCARSDTDHEQRDTMEGGLRKELVQFEPGSLKLLFLLVNYVRSVLCEFMREWHSHPQSLPRTYLEYLKDVRERYTTNTHTTASTPLQYRSHIDLYLGWPGRSLRVRLRTRAAE